MRYLIGVLIPLLLQALTVYIVVQTNTGNGSWAGLAAYLLGMFAIPATAVVNFVYLKTQFEKAPLRSLMMCFLFGLIVPVIAAVLLMIS